MTNDLPTSASHRSDWKAAWRLVTAWALFVWLPTLGNSTHFGLYCCLLAFVAARRPGVRGRVWQALFFGGWAMIGLGAYLERPACEIPCFFGILFAILGGIGWAASFMRRFLKEKLYRRQFTLRTALLVVLLASIALSGLAVVAEYFRNRSFSAAAIRESGGRVWYQERSIAPWQSDDGVEIIRGDVESQLERAKAFPRITVLTLRGPQITDAQLRHLTAFTHLQRLDLRYSGVTDAGIEQLQGLQRLRSLDLTGTKCAGAGARCLKNLPYLRDLVLYKCNIDDTGLETLHDLTQLRWIELTGTKVTEAGIKKLREALPDCKVYWEPPSKAARPARGPRRQGQGRQLDGMAP